MNTLHLIVHEALHRKLSSVLVLLALIVTVALPTAFFTAGVSSVMETRRLMRDLGYNLRIIPKGTDMERFWEVGYAEGSMPEDCVKRFETRPDLSYNHLIAMLHRRVDWDGVSIVLTGLLTEVSPEGKKKSSMIFKVERGTLYLGHTVATRLKLSSGATTTLRGKTFTIAETLSETGSEDDMRVYANLDDVQELLGAGDTINEIKALECHCQDPNIDTLPKLRAELEDIIPEGHVLRHDKMAVARKKQRMMVDSYFVWILPVILVASALWIALLLVLNVQQRREEIGILRALGHGTSRIAGLFVGKAAALGLVAGIIGFLVGTVLAHAVGPSIFGTIAGQVQTHWLLLPIVAVLAPLFAVVAALVPAMLAVVHDPAVTLRDDG
jgi:hypothetical protein